MKRKSPCRPPVNKGTVRQGSIAYRVMASLKEHGAQTAKDMHATDFPDKTRQQVVDTLCDLLKVGKVFRHSTVRQPKFRSLTVYTAEKPTHFRKLEPLTAAQRDQRYRERTRVCVASVFNWRGTAAVGDRA